MFPRFGTCVTHSLLFFTDLWVHSRHRRTKTSRGVPKPRGQGFSKMEKCHNRVGFVHVGECLIELFAMKKCVAQSVAQVARSCMLHRRCTDLTTDGRMHMI